MIQGKSWCISHVWNILPTYTDNNATSQDLRKTSEFQMVGINLRPWIILNIRGFTFFFNKSA